MCRFSFYITAALLTFGIGSFIAFKFFGYITNQTTIQSIEEFEQESSTPNQTSLQPTGDVVFNEVDECEEYSGEAIYQPIIRKWLHG